MSPGGNYINLVVFSPGKSATDFRPLALHGEVARDVAPKYYRRIRIHRVQASPNRATVLQTVALEYDRGDTVLRSSFNWFSK